MKNGGTRYYAPEDLPDTCVAGRDDLRSPVFSQKGAWVRVSREILDSQAIPRQSQPEKRRLFKEINNLGSVNSNPAPRELPMWIGRLRATLNLPALDAPRVLRRSFAKLPAPCGAPFTGERMKQKRAASGLMGHSFLGTGGSGGSVLGHRSARFGLFSKFGSRRRGQCVGRVRPARCDAHEPSPYFGIEHRANYGNSFDVRGISRLLPGSPRAFARWRGRHFRRGC